MYLRNVYLLKIFFFVYARISYFHKDSGFIALVLGVIFNTTSPGLNGKK